MPRKETRSNDHRIAQRPPMVDDELKMPPGLVRVGNMHIAKEMADELAFNDEKVMVRLEKAAEENASSWRYVASNGKYAEVWDERRKRWGHFFGYLPIGVVIGVKRKTVEVLARARLKKYESEIRDKDSERPRNITHEQTIQLQGLSIIQDTDKGHAWYQDLLQRYDDQ